MWGIGNDPKGRSIVEPCQHVLRLFYLTKSTMGKTIKNGYAEKRDAVVRFADEHLTDMVMANGTLADVLGMLQDFKAEGKDMTKECFIMIAQGGELIQEPTDKQLAWKGGEA